MTSTPSGCQSSPSSCRTCSVHKTWVVSRFAGSYQCQKNSSHTTITATYNAKIKLIAHPNQNAHLKYLKEISATTSTASSQASTKRYCRRLASIAAWPILGSGCANPTMATFEYRRRAGSERGRPQLKPAQQRCCDHESNAEDKNNRQRSPHQTVRFTSANI